MSSIVPLGYEEQLSCWVFFLCETTATFMFNETDKAVGQNKCLVGLSWLNRPDPNERLRTLHQNIYQSMFLS